MNNELLNFLHLLKRSGHYRFGLPYLTKSNAPKIALILTSDDLSEASKAKVDDYVRTYDIKHYDVPANVMSDLYPNKTIKVLIVTHHRSAQKIANLMKEGNDYE